MQFNEGNLIDYVQERPDPDLDWNNPECPFCGSVDIDSSEGAISTCMGWFPRVPEEDVPDCPGNPNTTFAVYICNDCKKKFYYSVELGCAYVCHDDPLKDDPLKHRRVILRGIPYGISVQCTYTCAACSGPMYVKQEYKPKGELFTDSKDPNHGYRLTCSDCDVNVLIHPNATYQPKVDYKNYNPDEPVFDIRSKYGVTVVCDDDDAPSKQRKPTQIFDLQSRDSDKVFDALSSLPELPSNQRKLLQREVLRLAHDPNQPVDIRRAALAELVGFARSIKSTDKGESQ